jgi:SnoaL-like domain
MPKEKHMQELIDRNEIAELVNRLGLWLDEKRFDEARSILTEDVAAETPGGTARGLEAGVEQARRNHDERTGTQHVITNCVINLDGDRATVGANLIATFFAPDQVADPRFRLGERYRFEAVRSPDGWRLSAIRTTPMWLEGTRPGT